MSDYLQLNFLKCDSCGVVVHETQDSRSESDQCGIGYSSAISPSQFYPCEGKLVPVRFTPVVR